MSTATKIGIGIASLIAAALSFWYGQNHGLLPEAASGDAREIDDLFDLMMTITTGLFLLIQGVLIFAAIRFRKRPDDETDGPPVDGNVRLEVTWTAIPTVIVLILSVYSFEVYNAMGGFDPAAARDAGPNTAAERLEAQLAAAEGSRRNLALGLGASPLEQQAGIKPLTVEVKGMQYAWIFTYPELGITAGELRVPTGRPVELKITASDVIHAFWLPEFRIKQDAIPGRQSQVRFRPDRVGTYPIVCAELCGPYHGAMKSQLRVQTPEAFQDWMQQRTVAQAPESQRAARDRSDREFLTPYAERMGAAATLGEGLEPQASAAATVGLGD